eukprot:TRINITY_DN41313_c0_g1_i1.p1 TRINITY_DN41313_c0_g1~~TRINITY_DN41313_c0_g1_i1.p1  ORF type:complete len:123 (-),score=49.31 TRINITY_DN41313_c0_g1_i1:582-950(-)
MSATNTRSKSTTSANGGVAAKFDINKVRKKLSDSKNRRIKRRHTVGGTKDFTEYTISSLDTQDKSKSAWDRLVPVLSNQELRKEVEDLMLEVEEDEEKEARRRSLPDCGAANLLQPPMESHV